ncbi:IS66 family transposase [Aquibium microcysteis]|uniref:IS66 family transposase n=1 Tax=Aquibium microcysteis TaxID=675281 RepID=UPI00165D1B7D|nr:IS66 family transposase [Aquibium microcysteis]
MSDGAAEIARLRAELAASDARARVAEAELAEARALVSTSEAMIAHLRLEIAKLRREQYGHSSERRARLIEQMELQLEDLEAAATEDEIASERAAARTTTVAAFERRRPARKPFPAHLPRERVVIEPPKACTCCGSSRIVKMGEDGEPSSAIGPRTMASETLEAVSRRWKVIQTVREKFTCRDCEKISQPPAPFHATPRGWAGPNLLATIFFEKFRQHQPLNRQAERYAREGVDLSLSTLADQVGTCSVALEPIHALIKAHVLAGNRLHGDDTTVPLLARGGTRQARLWTYVRDDRPFAGGASPAVLFHFSADREKTHPNRHLAGWTGVLQADAGACPRAGHRPDPGGGYNDLYRAGREPAPVTSALCWSHARRKFFELADVADAVRKGKATHAISPVALKAVERIDALFAIERDLNGLSADARRQARQELSRPLVEELHAWFRSERAQMSRHNPVAKAIDYMVEKDGRWDAFTRFLHDGRVCLTNNAAERALRGIALGRKAWLFAGSQRGGERAAFMVTLIVTAKLNDIDPQAWLADVLGRMPNLPMSRLTELLPWNWAAGREREPKAA